MMQNLNPQTMTPEQEQLARAQAFYLLKRFTSYTFLDKVRVLQQGFINAVAQQLNNPQRYEQVFPEGPSRMERYEMTYRNYLEAQIPTEQGLHLLRTTPHKLEAYRTLTAAQDNFREELLGRMAIDHRIGDEPFFQDLGLPPTDSDDPYSGKVREVLDAGSLLSHADQFLFNRETGERVNGEFKFYLAFNFDNLLSERFYKGSSKYVYPLNYPANLPACPPHNDNKNGQVWSGNEIPVTGIYEPWLMSGKVGCPNYYLKSQQAIEYQLEGLDETEGVFWRLIWEDKRYLDGTIPQEEAAYFAGLDLPEPQAKPASLTARPGQPCPQAGLWFSPHLQMNEVRMQLGEPMPGQNERGVTGDVIWYFKG